MDGTELVSKYQLLLDASLLVELLDHTPSQAHLVHLADSSDSVKVHISGGVTLPDVAFILGGLPLLFNYSYLIKDWLHYQLIEALVDKPVWLREHVQIDSRVGN